MTPTPTVLHVETGRQLYGGALQVSYLMRGLKARGWRNVLVCTAGAAIAATPEADRVYALPMRGDVDIGFIGRLRKVIHAERPDVIHLHSRRGADVLGGIAARLAGVPVVLSRRVDNPEARVWVGIKYRLYDRVVTISRGIYDVLLAEGVPSAKLVCVPSAVDSTRVLGPCERTWFEREFGIVPGEAVVAMIAQFIPRKGHRYLLEAIPAILARCPQTRFLLLGQGPLLPEVRAHIASAGVSDRVQAPGFRDDLERMLKCFDLVVHPAEMEGLGVALLQAAAAGVPVVASAVGGIPEIVRDGLNGILVPPREVAALTHAITQLLADPARARALGANGRELARREFSIDAMVEGNLRVYRELLKPD